MIKGYSLVFIFLFVVVITSVAGGAYYLGQRSSSKTTIPLPTKTQQPNNSSQLSSQETQDPLFTGKVKKITNDLGLFNVLENDKENSVSQYIAYFEAGTFARGEFKGYARILAIRPAEGPGPSLQFVLATKDYKTYLLDDPENRTVNYPESDGDNPYKYIDKSKITRTVTLDTEHPETIGLEKQYGLIKQNDALVESKKNGQKDKNGNDVYLEEPITQFEQSQFLTSPVKQLIFHAGSTDWGSGDGYSDTEKKWLNIRKKYIHSTTYVHTSDSTGLTYPYILSTQNDIDSYLSKLPSFEQALIAYKRQVVLYDEKKLKEFPAYPDYPSFPGMRLTKSLVGLSDNYYNSYDVSFPGACGGNQSTDIIDTLSNTDLESVSSSSVYPLYILKDNKHPLYELAYQTKTGTDDESFKAVNDGKSKPSFDEYVAKHPLLFFKDAWGRWGGQWESLILSLWEVAGSRLYTYTLKKQLLFIFHLPHLFH